VRAGIGALAAKAGGVDALVFSAGIGEHSAEIRQQICAPLAFMGFTLNTALNESNATRIELAGNKPIVIIPADEEIMIRDLCLNAIE
jgi:acetate kinase